MGPAAGDKEQLFIKFTNQFDSLQKNKIKQISNNLISPQEKNELIN